MKKKVLIIGSSKSIKKLSKLLFKSESSITYINFRKAWEFKKINKYDIIFLTGFHYKICYVNMRNFNIYLNEYYNFISYLKKKCKKLILLTTFLKINYSFCRVVYFYHRLLNDYNLLNKSKIEVYNFKKIINLRVFPAKYVKSILLYFNFENTENVANKFANYEIKKTKFIKFYLLSIPRTRLIDRILRIF